MNSGAPLAARHQWSGSMTDAAGSGDLPPGDQPDTLTIRVKTLAPASHELTLPLTVSASLPAASPSWPAPPGAASQHAVRPRSAPWASSRTGWCPWWAVQGSGITSSTRAACCRTPWCCTSRVGARPGRAQLQSPPAGGGLSAGRAAGVRSGHALHFVERPAAAPSRQASQTGEPAAASPQQPGPGHHAHHITFGQINIVGSPGDPWDAEQFNAVRTHAPGACWRQASMCAQRRMPTGAAAVPEHAGWRAARRCGGRCAPCADRCRPLGRAQGKVTHWGAAGPGGPRHVHMAMGGQLQMPPPGPEAGRRVRPVNALSRPCSGSRRQAVHVGLPLRGTVESCVLSPQNAWRAEAADSAARIHSTHSLRAG